MIDIYSPHGKEKEISDFLYHYLKKQGLPVIRQQVEEDRENILVIPDIEEPQLVLLGHIDTVPAPDFENYKYNLIARDRDTICGLGSADMKGGCAAMIEAYIHHWHQNSTPPPVALALVVGEEESGDGTTSFLSEYTFPYAIVGEPTNLNPCFSHYGYIEANISTSGKGIHASLASDGVNAIEVMMHQLLKVIEYLKSHRQEVIYNIRNLSSSHTGFVVPEYCEVFIDFHVPPNSAIGDIIYELEELFTPEGEEKAILTPPFISPISMQATNCRKKENSTRHCILFISLRVCLLNPPVSAAIPTPTFYGPQASGLFSSDPDNWKSPTCPMNLYLSTRYKKRLSYTAAFCNHWNENIYATGSPSTYPAA